MSDACFRIKIASESALSIYYQGDTDGEISESAADWIRVVCCRIKRELGNLVIEMIPSYASVLVSFDPYITDHYQVRHRLRLLLTELNTKSPWEHQDKPGKLVELPVYYSEQTGPDLERIAIQAQCSIEEVITEHQSVTYRVYAIGFAPGFAYLGQVPQRLTMPRLSTPRALVPKGSVAIADRQTAIYPADSPGGWNILGRCPMELFSAANTPHMPFDVGDRVRFFAIDRTQFIELGGVL